MSCFSRQVGPLGIQGIQAGRLRTSEQHKNIGSALKTDDISPEYCDCKPVLSFDVLRPMSGNAPPAVCPTALGPDRTTKNTQSLGTMFFRRRSILDFANLREVDRGL